MIKCVLLSMATNGEIPDYLNMSRIAHDDLAKLSKSLFRVNYYNRGIIRKTQLERLGEVTFPNSNQSNKGNLGIYVKHPLGFDKTFTPSSNNLLNNKNKIFNEINITPLTDIFLVLLIIMMVVAPSFQSVDSQIEIPEINSGVSVEETNATVAITKDGAMYLNDKPVENEEILAVELSNIKEMFYSTKKNGTGLGVALSNEIVEAHNGELCYSSVLGEGTECIVSLPL